MNDSTGASGLPGALATEPCPNCATLNLGSALACVRCATPLGPTLSGFAPTELSTDERTVLCTAIDGDRGAVDRARQPSTSAHALADGTRIEGFRIVRPLGEGGFGIVYLAWDEALERHVAIKEYMPYALATRASASLDVTVRTERDRDVFDAGLKGFVNEARLLARFDHPALVKVLRFWEAHRTAYMAMPYYEGPTLKAALAEVRQPASEQQLRDWLGPLLAALTVLHDAQCYHRDISPDNILLTARGPLLLDFGAARRVIGDQTQALTAMLKPGFAPIEQYGGTLLQGPWTDLYALAGVMRYAITGRPPVASVGRVVDDVQRPLAQTHAGGYSDGFLRALDAALSVRPEHRPQDVAAFRALLSVGQPDEGAGAFPQTVQLVPARPPSPSPSPSAAPLQAPEGPPSSPSPVPKSAMARQPVPAAAAHGGAEPTAFGDLFEMEGPTVRSATPRAPTFPLPRRRRTRPALLAGIALCMAAGAGWFTLSSSPVVQPAAATVTAMPPPAPSVPTVPVATVPMAAPVMSETVAAPASVEAGPRSAPPASAAARAEGVRLAERAGERPRRIAAAAPPAGFSAPGNEQQVTSAYTQPARSPRCGDLVLKASLEPLQPEDIAFLKSRCR